MNRIVQYIRNKKYHLIFAAVFIIGVCVHGSRIFTAYYAHDDATMVGVGTTYTSGRWFLQMLYKVQVLIMGSSINAKGFMGIVVLGLFAVICCMMAYGFGINSKRGLLLLSGIVMTFPYIPSLLCYTYTAPHYCISIIMSLVAAILMQSECRGRRKCCRMLGGVVLLGLSMAIYQTSLCIYVAFLAALAVRKSLDMEAEPWKDYIVRCLGYLFGCLGGCVFYYLSNKIVLHIKGFSMSGYQGLDHMEKVNLSQLFSRTLMAYKEFFIPTADKNYSFYHELPIRWCYSFILLALFVCVLIFLIQEIRCKNYRKFVQLLVLFGILPLAINSVFLTADVSTTNIYSLMMFSEVMVYICLIDEIERLRLKKWKLVKLKLLRKLGYGAVVALLAYTMLYFGYIANVCYTKAAIQQEQTISYFNRLITRIQMMEGYSIDTPVAYINEWNKNTESQSIWFIDDDGYSIAAYNYASLVNMYNWKEYMRMWCGFQALEVSREVLEEYSLMPEVQEMPTYPNYGSIKIIDGVIVVKFDPY